MQRTYLPIIPTTALRRHRVHEPLDHRFRAAARLLQSLWRAKKGLPVGSYTRRSREASRLGSLITEKAGGTGANFLLPEIARLARREASYREPGALIEERRLWCNLLSSMPLTFNAFGPLKLDLNLATKMLRALLPALVDATVDAVLFEHSPGRGNRALTGDHTAFDVVLTYVRPGGTNGFVAIEVKYAESMTDAHKQLSARYAELAASAGLHRDPDAQVLTYGPLQQFYRQHLLAHAMIERGAYAEATFMVLAPALNTPVQSAIVRYTDQLTDPVTGNVAFAAVTLEQFVDQLRQCGHRAYAKLLFERYLDWPRVDEVIEKVIADFGRGSTVGNDNAEPRPAVATDEAA